MIKSAVEITRVRPESFLGRACVDIMNNDSNGRITQDSLDMYRGEFDLLDDFKYKVVMMAALFRGEVIGMSAGITDGKTMTNGITVVRGKYRKMGVGQKLMRAKATEIISYWPDAKISTKVATNNVPSMRSLIKAGYKALDVSTTKKNNGATVNCFTFIWPQ